MAREKKNGKRGWHKADDPTGVGHKDAGHKGGVETARRHGPEFYSEIGRKGGQASPGKFKKGDKRAEEAGRKGGQARASQ